MGSSRAEWRERGEKVSDRPIQVGDLVAVVKSCCPRVAMPSVFKVGQIGTFGFKVPCPFCLSEIDESIPIAQIDGEAKGRPIAWLKRIPPLEELEGVKTADKVPA